jgi:hypothetical protein
VCLQGEPHMLRRLMRNLLENAQRYAAGSVIEASVEPSPDGIRLSVADRGPGVPEEERERIFEPFYRSTRLREPSDTGVGLDSPWYARSPAITVAMCAVWRVRGAAPASRSTSPQAIDAGIGLTRLVSPSPPCFTWRTSPCR